MNIMRLTTVVLCMAAIAGCAGQAGNRTERQTTADPDQDPGGVRSGMRRRVAAGYGHSCLIDDAERLVCWGHNGFGQLGSDDLGDWRTVVVDGLPDRPIAVTAGAYHTCALTASEEVFCWGQNAYGQLGDGSNEVRTIPVRVARLPGAIVEVSAGSTHTCARDEGGGVYCWGQNGCGQLGDGTQTD